MNSKNAPDSQPIYTEWKDFYVECEKEWNLTHLYFYGPEWNLVWYIKLEYQKTIDGPFCFEKCIIIDTISLHKAEENMSSKRFQFFLTKWYTWKTYRWFWVSMYKYTFKFIKSEYWAKIGIFVDAYTKNTKIIEDLIERTRLHAWDLIQSVWWARDYVAYLRLKDDESNNT